jgi:hypothetical protein
MHVMALIFLRPEEEENVVPLREITRRYYYESELV